MAASICPCVFIIDLVRRGVNEDVTEGEEREFKSLVAVFMFGPRWKNGND
jgi:hypothetical protein